VFSVATKRWRKGQETHNHATVAALPHLERLGEFATSLKKGAYVEVESEFRRREYEKYGVPQCAFECHFQSSPKGKPDEFSRDD
jgi:hypothetical protein